MHFVDNTEKAKTASKLLGSADWWVGLHQEDIIYTVRTKQTVLFGLNGFIERDNNLTLAQERASS